MAFLGDIGKALGIGNINKGPTGRAVFSVARAILPPLVATELAIGAAAQVAGQTQSQSKSNVIQGGQNYTFYEQTQNPYAAPPAYSVYFQDGGSTPWDYSTSSIPFSIPLAVSPEISSTPQSGLSWEDLLEARLRT